ncbi:MAG: alpha/beta hydrolase [Clostridiales bacterium]|nr:alpha/beta hydrolase [Clostridiales bacterium]
MTFGFSYIGLIMLLMLFVPNFLWTKNQPKDYDKYVKNENKVLLAFERTGQVIVTTSALIFSNFNPKGWNFWCWVLVLAFLNLVVYDIAWIRYFKSEKTMKDFYKGFIGMPIALATYPVIAFFLLGIYGGNIIMIAGSIILGIGHIGIHLQHRNEACGKPAKKKLPVRIITGILKGIGIVILLFVFGIFIYCIAIRNYKEVSRAIDFKDGVNEGIYVKLTDQEEYLLIMGKKVDNPVIISLHGGPGAPTTFMDYCFIDYLTDDYTVVCWDERGCGRSYYRNMDTDPDNETLSFEKQQDDLDALVDYCCDRFGQDKVIIMGHSYGSMLGTTYVMDHPDKVSAYIGIGQCIDERDFAGEIYSYEDALEKARAKGDDTSEMEAAYEEFINDIGSLPKLQALRSCVEVYHPQGDMTDVSTMAAVTSPYAGVDDVRWYCLEMSTMMGNTRFEELEGALDDTLMSFYIGDLGADFEVPVFFLSGGDDWICPVGLIEDYYEQMNAPYKDIYLLEGCGHSPQGQYPEECANAIKDFLSNT